MADGGNTFRFSGETRDLMKDHIDFFDVILPVLKEAKMGFKAGDNDARSERTFLNDGSVSLTFIYPIDDNETAADGRIYLKDTFVFDADETKIKKFKREFEFNGKGGNSPKWEAWAQKFRDAPMPGKDVTKSFSYLVARSYSRPLTPTIVQALKTQKTYLLKALEAAGSLDNKWKLRVGDDESHFNLVYRDDALEVTVSLVMDNDENNGNGRLFFHDKFTLDPKTFALKAVERNWHVGRDSKNVAGLKDAVDSLDKVPQPTLAEASPYIAALLPGLLQAPSEGGDKGDWQSKLALAPPIPKDYESPFVKNLKDRATFSSRYGESVQEASDLALEIMQTVAVDQREREADENRGWFNRLVGKNPGDALAETENLKTLFAKAKAQLGPGVSAMQALEKAELNNEQKALRQRLLSDPLLRRALFAAQDPDPEIRAHQLMLFAREDLIKGEGLAASANLIAEKIKTEPGVKAEAESLLAFLRGEGSIGTKVEYLTPLFAKQVTSPSAVAAMVVAGPLGCASEGLGLATVGRIPFLGRPLVQLAGVSGEALAFTTLHKGFESATMNPEKVWKDWGSETVSATMLFGMMRVGHWVTGGMTKWISEGGLGNKWGSKQILTEAPSFAVNPVGRIRINSFPVEVPGAPLSMARLTRRGMALTGLLHTAGGVGSMWAAGELSQSWHLRPANQQKFGGRLFDAFVSYGQAMVGFNLANGATGGRLQSWVAEGRMRLDAAQGKTIPQAKAKSEPPKPKSERPDTSSKPALKYGETEFSFSAGGKSVDVKVPPPLKRIWIGHDPNRAEGIHFDEASDAFFNVPAGDQTVSRFHAQLTREQSGVWYFADLGSDYGTAINGDSVIPEGKPVLFEPDSIVRLGDSTEVQIGVSGEFIKPEKPRPPKVRPTTIPQQPLPPPPQVAKFPFDKAFPSESFLPDVQVVVATIGVPEGRSVLFSNATQWRLPLDGFDGFLYVDAKARWVLAHKMEGDFVKINGKAIRSWTFLHDGDKIELGDKSFSFSIPRVPEVIGDGKPKDPQVFEMILQKLKGKKRSPDSVPPPPPPETPDPSGEATATPPVDGEGGVPDWVDDRPTGEIPAFVVPAEAFRPDEESGVHAAPTATTTDVTPSSKERKDTTQTFHYPPAADGDPNKVSFTAVSKLNEAGHPVPATGEDLRQTEVKTDKPISEPPISPGRRVPRTDLTSPGGVAIIPEVATSFPIEMLAPLGSEPPLTLLFGGRAYRGSQDHTSYIIGSSPTDLKAHQQGIPYVGKANVNTKHAEIFYSDNGQWYLHDLTSEHGTYIDRGGPEPHRLQVNQYITLRSGDKVFLGPPKDPESLELIFELPGNKPRERLTTLGYGAHSMEALAHAAPEFPITFLSNLNPNHPAATFKIGSVVIDANREATSYTLGRAPKKSGELNVPVNLAGDLISSEHAKIFIDHEGQWWVQDLNSTNGTYRNGEKIPVGVPVPIHNNDRIGLGSPDLTLGSQDLIFEKPPYLGSVRPERSGDSVSEALGDDDFEIVDESKLPAPPPPDSQSRPARRPPPPAPKSKSQPKPDSKPAPAKPDSKPAPAAKPAAPAGPPPSDPPADGDPMDWGDLMSDDAVPESNTGMDSSSSAPTAPPPPSDPPGRGPQASGVFDQAYAAAQLQGELSTLRPEEGHGEESPPDVTSVRAAMPHTVPRAVGDTGPHRMADARAQLQMMSGAEPQAKPVGPRPVAPQVRLKPRAPVQAQETPPVVRLLDPYLNTNHNVFKESIKALGVELDAFPRVDTTPSRSFSGEEHDFIGVWDQIHQFHQTKHEGVDPALVEPVLEQLKVIGMNFWAGNKFGQSYTIHSDGLCMQFGSKGAEVSDTAISFPLKPGAEGETFHAVFNGLLAKDNPMEVVFPLVVTPNKPGYLVIKFNAKNFASVYERVQAFYKEYHETFKDARMPFANALLDNEGHEMPGVGVMEYPLANDKENFKDPLQLRRQFLIRAYNHTRPKQGDTFDDRAFLREVIEILATNGFDLINPAFRKESLTGTHQEVVQHSRP